MDALYDNLDNYNEAKLIEELRNENQDLKVKIEKYTDTLEKLQKDFDNLAAEYKKLEFNYSSLLKTARAEIERKTQIITNLNIEKDMMVLNAIQNGNVQNVRRNWAMAKQNKNIKGNEEAAPNRNASNQPKFQSSNTGRKENPKTSTEDINNPVSAENTNKNIKNEKSVEHASDAKENIHVIKKDKPASIRDRRKSMPATSFSVAKFSSDEEREVSPVIELRKDYISKESDSWKNSDRNPIKDNQPFDCRNRNYDSDKYRNNKFESQRHRFSPERFLHRSRRDYSGDRRFPRNRSKDHRQYRDGSGGYRSDKDGERFYRDGPGDNRHYRDKSGDCRPYRDNLGDHRPIRDGSGENRPRRDDNLVDHRPYRDGSGENRPRREDYLGDHRTHRGGSGENRTHREDKLGDHRPHRDESGENRTRREDYLGDHRTHRGGSGENRPRREEPALKKPEVRKRRLESPTGDKFQQYQQKNHEEFEREYNDERNKFIEDAGKPIYHSDYEVPSNKRMRTDSYNRSDHNSKYVKEKSLDKAPQSAVGCIQSEDMSCQSPDYLSTELASVPKEIKLDAEVKIDDPREHSNKYTIRTENGEKVLTTVAGRIVDLKPVNKSVWKIENVQIPVALVRPPSYDSMNDIYGDMDIDDAASDISSAESGETMGSIYDISTDPFHYDRFKDISGNQKNGDKKCYEKHVTHSEKDMTQAEEVNSDSKNIEKVCAQIEDIDDMPEVSTVPTEGNVEQEIMQTEPVVEYTLTIDKGVISAENITDYPKTDENLTVQPHSQLVDPQSSKQDSIKTERAVLSNTEKETISLEKNITDTIDTKKHTSTKSNLSSYKIPKLKNKDQSGNSERKLSDNKHTEHRLGVHDKNITDKKRTEDRLEVSERQLLDDKVGERQLSDSKCTEDKLEVDEKQLSDNKRTNNRLEVRERKLSDNKCTEDKLEVDEKQLSHNKRTEDRLVVGERKLSDNKGIENILEVDEKQLSDNKRIEDRLEVGERQLSVNKRTEDRLEAGERQLSNKKRTEDRVEVGERQPSDNKRTEDRVDVGERQPSDNKHTEDRVEVGERQRSDNKRTEDRVSTLSESERHQSENRCTGDMLEVDKHDNVTPKHKHVNKNTVVDATEGRNNNMTSERQPSDNKHTENRVEVGERQPSDNKRTEDRVEVSERHQSENRCTGDMLEVDKHDNVTPKHKHVNKNTVVDATERRNNNMTSERQPSDKKHTENRVEVGERQPSDNKRTEDRVEVSERHQSENRCTGDMLEVDKHDNVTPKHKHANKNTVVDATESRNIHMTTVAGDKGMVEGDLELSDESSDIDLLKRVMKNVEKQSPRQNSRVATKNVLNKDDKKESVHCLIDKSITNNFSETNVDLKLKIEDKTKSKSSDTSKKGKSKITTSKQKSDKEKLKIPPENVALSTHSKLQETEVLKDMKSKFSDLFGDSSSLITPEDLGLTAQDVRIESCSTNYFPIFEDAQDAADLGGKVSQTKSDRMAFAKEPHVGVAKPVINIVQNKCIDKSTDKNEKINIPSKSKEKKTHTDKPTDKNIIKHKPRQSKSLEKEEKDLKPIDKNTKTKSCRNTENEHVSKKVEVTEKTKTSKDLEKQQVKKIDVEETKTKSKPNKNVNKERHDVRPLETTDDVNKLKSRTKHSKNETDETRTKDTCSKYLETEKCHTPMETNKTNSQPSKEVGKTEAHDTKTKTIETRKRKSRRQEDNSPLMIETGETPQPAVITIVTDKTSAELICDKSHSNTKEPEVVKTVIISSGIQPFAVQENMPVNVISPILDQPVTPNIDSRTQMGIPILGNTVRIHALATSTPAKEIVQNVQDVSCRTPDVSNTSNDQSSINNNEMDAPDVRIFVKRRRRVIKKTTPTKT